MGSATSAASTIPHVRRRWPARGWDATVCDPNACSTAISLAHEPRCSRSASPLAVASHATPPVCGSDATGVPDAPSAGAAATSHGVHGLSGRGRQSICCRGCQRHVSLYTRTRRSTVYSWKPSAGGNGHGDEPGGCHARLAIYSRWADATRSPTARPRRNTPRRVVGLLVRNISTNLGRMHPRNDRQRGIYSWPGVLQTWRSWTRGRRAKVLIVSAVFFSGLESYFNDNLRISFFLYPPLYPIALCIYLVLRFLCKFSVLWVISLGVKRFICMWHGSVLRCSHRGMVWWLHFCLRSRFCLLCMHGFEVMPTLLYALCLLTLSVSSLLLAYWSLR